MSNTHFFSYMFSKTFFSQLKKFQILPKGECSVSRWCNRLRFAHPDLLSTEPKIIEVTNSARRWPPHWLRLPDQSIAANLSAVQVSFWEVAHPGWWPPPPDPRVFKGRFLTTLSGSAYERHGARQHSWKPSFWRWARERASWWCFESHFSWLNQESSLSITSNLPIPSPRCIFAGIFAAKVQFWQTICPRKRSQTEKQTKEHPQKPAHWTPSWNF